MFCLAKFPMAVIHSLIIVARTHGTWVHQWLTHPTPHPTKCTVTSPFPSPPHLALPPSRLTCLPGSQFIYVIMLHFIYGTYRPADVHVYIKGTLRYISYFHCRRVHYAIPAVTELYRHPTVLRYCRCMHLQYIQHTLQPSLAYLPLFHLSCSYIQSQYYSQYYFMSLHASTVLGIFSTLRSSCMCMYTFWVSILYS